jgi:hypothetical protein
MFNLAAGNDWFVGLIRTTIFPPMAKYILGIEAVRRRFFILISQIGIRYRQSSLSEHQDDDDFEVEAGDRMPYCLLDGKSIYDQLREPKFHLLTFSGGIDLGGLEKYAQLFDHHAVELTPDAVVAFGTDKPFLLLLRPDNYIGVISADMSTNVLANYFREVFG